MEFQVDTGVKKLLKSGKDLDDALVAAVIRNLKVVQVCDCLDFIYLFEFKDTVIGFRKFLQKDCFSSNPISHMRCKYGTLELKTLRADALN